MSSARKSLSPVLDSSGSVVVKRRSPEEMEKELRGEVATELSLPLKEGRGGEGQSLDPANGITLVDFLLCENISFKDAFLRGPAWNRPFSQYLILSFR